MASLEPRTHRNPTYFPGDLRRELLDRALAVIELDGPAGISLRALAREVGVSHAAPKNHFPDKAALFEALAIEGFEHVERRWSKATNSTGPGDRAAERLRRGAVDYVAFARECPGYFGVMWQPDLHRHSDAVSKARDQPFSAWVGLMREAQQEGMGQDLEIGTLVEIAWALVTGLATLAQIRGGPMGKPLDERAAELVLRTVMNRLE